MLSAHSKALLISNLLSVLLGIKVVLNFSSIGTFYPLVLFYVLLIIQTYLSVKLFSKLITSQTTLQICTDILLVIYYVALIFSIHSPVIFSLLLTLFFILAVCKYLLIRNFLHPKLLKRKIFFDVLGVILAGSTYIIVRAGFPAVGMWWLLILFFIGSVYTLILRQLYRKDE